jgi:hypothetical protein
MDTTVFVISTRQTGPRSIAFLRISLQSIRHHYPATRVYLIDDASADTSWHADPLVTEDALVRIVEPVDQAVGQGELNPYVWLLHNAERENIAAAFAVHDSIVFHRSFPEWVSHTQCSFVWDFSDNINWVGSHHHGQIRARLAEFKARVEPSKWPVVDYWLGALSRPTAWKACFGSQSYISVAYLAALEKHCSISKLYGLLKSRGDRMVWETVFALACYSLDRLGGYCGFPPTIQGSYNNMTTTNGVTTIHGAYMDKVAQGR